VALVRFRLGTLTVIASCAALGLALHLIGWRG